MWLWSCVRCGVLLSLGVAECFSQRIVESLAGTGLRRRHRLRPGERPDPDPLSKARRKESGEISRRDA